MTDPGPDAELDALAQATDPPVDKPVGDLAARAARYTDEQRLADQRGQLTNPLPDDTETPPEAGSYPVGEVAVLCFRGEHARCGSADWCACPCHLGEHPQEPRPPAEPGQERRWLVRRTTETVVSARTAGQALEAAQWSTGSSETVEVAVIRQGVNQ